MTALRRLIREVMAPTDGSPYVWAVIGHVMLGAVLGPYSTDGTGALGRCISVVCAPENTAANPEPAVLAARQWLAKRYKVAVT